jgi:hypothetical protein
MCSESAAVSRDLPIPGSPEISTARPSLLCACSHRRISSSISSSRPRLEPAHRAAFAQHPPCQLRLGKAGERLRPEVFQIEKPADLLAGRFADDQRVRRGPGLQPGGEVRRLTDDPALLRRTLADQIRRPRRARWRRRALRANPVAPAIG